MASGIGKKASNLFVWAILALLLVALAGFGITSFSGGSAVVGRVGSAEITAEDYARALDAEIRARSAQTGQQVRLADLTAQGVDRAVLQNLIAQAALLNEAREMGLSVGDAEVARQVRAIPEFRGPDGFSREAYEFEIGRLGLSPAEFEEDMRENTTRSLLQLAVAGGIQAPDLLAEALVAREMERRSFTLATLSEDTLPDPLPEPSEAELQEYYDANPEDFTAPEQRRITYAWVTPEQIMDDMEIDEDTLRGLYEDRIEQYVQPERRLVERLVFPDQDAAEAARARIDSGEAVFDDLVEARGLTLDDVDLGDVSRDALSDAAAAAVFVDEDVEIVGPVDSAFGPAIFRINAVLDATEVTFEEAEDDLRAELAVDAARRAISAEREAMDDALAGGATIEELAQETLMTLGTIDFDATSNSDIAAYDSFRDAAGLVAEGDFPELLELSDGGLFALRLDEIVAPQLLPIEDVVEAVEAGWYATTLREALQSRAQELLAQMATLGATLEDQDLPLTSETGISRQDFIPDTPPTLVAQMFQLEAEGDMVVIPGADRSLIARLDAIEPGNVNAPEISMLLDLIGRQAGQAIAQDMFSGFGAAMDDEVGIELNQAMINGVHANFP